jgi:hypothetical protein
MRSTFPERSHQVEQTLQDIESPRGGNNSLMLKKSVFGTTLLSSLISERTTRKLYGTCDEVKADVGRYFDISSALITRNAGTESFMELRGKLH